MTFWMKQGSFQHMYFFEIKKVRLAKKFFIDQGIHIGYWILLVEVTHEWMAVKKLIHPGH